MAFRHRVDFGTLLPFLTVGGEQGRRFLNLTSLDKMISLERHRRRWLIASCISGTAPNFFNFNLISRLACRFDIASGKFPFRYSRNAFESSRDARWRRQRELMVDSTDKAFSYNFDAVSNRPDSCISIRQHKSRSARSFKSDIMRNSNLQEIA